MAQAGLFVTPMTRKKRIEDKYSPNTWRVISQDAENATASIRIEHQYTASASDYRNVIGQRPLDQLHPVSDFRQNRPNPRSVGFLRQDVALLNEPVCDVRTRATATEQPDWWPTRANTSQQSIPPHTLDTTARQDFQYRGEKVKPERSKGPSSQGNSRGIVPVSKMAEPDRKPRFWKEGISYEHQFNSRLDPQYFARGKRHGNFVWSRMKDDEVAKVMGDAPVSSIINRNEQMTIEKPEMSASALSPISSSAAATLPPVE